MTQAPPSPTQAFERLKELSGVFAEELGRKANNMASRNDLMVTADFSEGEGQPTLAFTISSVAGGDADVSEGVIGALQNRINLWNLSKAGCNVTIGTGLSKSKGPG